MTRARDGQAEADHRHRVSPCLVVSAEEEHADDRRRECFREDDRGGRDGDAALSSAVA